MHILGKCAMQKTANTDRTKVGNIWNEMFISYEHRARTIKLQTCIQVHINLKTVRDKKGNLLTDTHSILCTSKNHFCQLYKLYEISNVM
jgi:hypothetical protein